MQSRPNSRLHKHTLSNVPEILGIHPSICILSFCSNKSTQTRAVPVWRIRPETLLYVERVAGHVDTFPNGHFPPRICRLRIHCNICTIPKKKTHTPFLTILTFLNDSNTLLKYSPMPTRKLHGIMKDLTALDALITIVQFSTYEFDITNKIRHVCKTRTREMTPDGLVLRREGETRYIPFLVQIIYINIMTNGEKRKTGRNKKTVTSSGKTPPPKKKKEKLPNYIELHRNSVIDI